MKTIAKEHCESGEEQPRLYDKEVAFLIARAATGRTAREPEKNPLLDPNVYVIALHTAREACGPVVDGARPFPSTLWLGGATDTYDGRAFTGTLLDFVKLLKERATKLAPKREGWVIEPTTNTDGHRTNVSTSAVHALFLDCDGTGAWDPLLSVLAEHDLAYIAYQSGGYTPKTPKWRVVLPLSQPFDTSNNTKQSTWKAIYTHARVVFGALGQLRGVGFDPATDTPCCPWFLTEKRDEKDPPREIVWRPGHSLDLMALALALPVVEENELSTRKISPGIATATDLSDERREEIVSALADATASVSSDRRGIYLSLPGVLLDRGICPEDVLIICEDVSSRYPRSHPEKHADNLRCAQTTVGKWESDGKVTRIGTLNSVAPRVAQVLDSVLPDPTTKALTESMQVLCAPVRITTTITAVAPKKRRKLLPLGRELAPIAAKMKLHKDPLRRIDGTLIERVISGESLQSSTSTTKEVDDLVCRAMQAIGFQLPKTSWADVLDLASRTLLSMDFTQSTTRVDTAAQAFSEGQAQRKMWIAKKNKKTAELRAHARSFFNEIQKRG